MHINGRNRVLISGPGQNDADRSLVVSFDPSHSRRYHFVFCVGDKWEAYP